MEGSADKTKYMPTTRDQNAGRSYNIQIDNNSFERVEEFKYLITTLTNQNSGRNKEQIEIRDCLLSFAANFCPPASSPKIQRLKHTEL
jgi:hypothetical protein